MPPESLTGSDGFNWLVYSASGRTWPSRRILSAVGELLRRGGGGNLGVRRTLAVRSGLIGSVVVGFEGPALVTDREPSCRHNEALKQTACRVNVLAHETRRMFSVIAALRAAA
jgi:hypothetical protein